MTRTEIQDWLVAYLAKELRLAPAAVDVDATLVDMGLTSRQAVLLAGELEDWLGVAVEPDVAWDHPTIAALSAHLAGG